MNRHSKEFFYFPKFVDEDTANSLWKNVYNAPKPKWKQLRDRRLQNWGGLPHPKGMIAESMPQWLINIIDRIESIPLPDHPRPNHTLINEYLPGQGIMPHHDGPLYYPMIFNLSLGSPCLMDFYEPNIDGITGIDEICFSLLLEPCSLVVLTGDLYTHYLHGIASRTADDLASNDIVNMSLLGTSYENEIDRKITRKNRLSLTIRHVPKVLKMKI